MASSEDTEIGELLKNSLLDVTSPDNKLVQDVKQWLASHSERREKIDGLMSRVKDLEDELKVAQSELDRAAMNSKQIKEELTKQCKEHHETIKRYLKKEIHKSHDETRQGEDDLAKHIASAEENFIVSVETLSKATGEITKEIENIKEDHIEKFATLEEDVKAINSGINRNQEDLKSIKEKLQTFQARTVATEEKLLSKQNRTKGNLNVLTFFMIFNFTFLVLIVAWVYSITVKLNDEARLTS